MAELTPAPAEKSSCCSTEAQAACCDPSEKSGCCTPESGNCGCSAGVASEQTDVREVVRERYAAAARVAAGTQESACACAVGTTDEHGTEVFGSALYSSDEDTDGAEGAIAASLGCGVPTAVADLQPGQTVLDLGSGAGADVLISARRVAPTGKAIGLDMTDEMLDLARSNAERAGIDNVEFIKGYLEEMPLPDGSVDVVISNCVINLSGDKPKTISEAARVLKPGGQFAISDVIADPGMDERTKADMAAWTGCIAGALTEDEFRQTLVAAGLEEIEIQPTHQVHAHASAAIIRARKPCSASPRTT